MYGQHLLLFLCSYCSSDIAARASPSIFMAMERSFSISSVLSLVKQCQRSLAKRDCKDVIIQLEVSVLFFQGVPAIINETADYNNFFSRPVPDSRNLSNVRL
jgi:hypothetical protein